MQRCLAVWCVLWMASAAWADGPADNIPEKVRPIPPVGIEVPEATRAELLDGLSQLERLLADLAKSPIPRVTALLPDVQIFHRAVSEALAHQEFFNEKELAAARELLREGLARAKILATGDAPWTSQAGLVVRGYVSRIDGSVQPYGLVVPPSYNASGALPHRLDIWFHGRNEDLSEVNFLTRRQSDRGIFTPPDAFVLHPYGRYCNAFKFAGEVDVLEALAAVKANYRIDQDRVAVRGFSMGGAGCWHFAVHYPTAWVGATPGAGFSETPDFLRVFQKEDLNPTWYEKKLWQWYDCTGWAANLYQCPTIAYSGENDIQKQAADLMAEALKREHIELVHLVGPKTGHNYHPQAREEIDRRLTEIVARGRERMPRSIRFVTYTLKYNTSAWVTVDALGAHWEQARVEADLERRNAIDLRTNNVTALSLRIPSGASVFDLTQPVKLTIDGETLAGPQPWSDRSWSCALVRSGGHWTLGSLPADGLRKRHDLQGPIDDAFMDSFVFVTPTSQPRSEAVGKWVQAELEHATAAWRRQFRGMARVKKDTDITADDIAGSHLVLWGDPASNAVLQKIADQLPIRWGETEIEAGDQRFPSAHHAPVCIYPNPLNPQRYVVLNSSFTYREYEYLNNARQVPKLPDWAIIDVRTPPDSRWPGKVVAADFFDENWKLQNTGRGTR